MTDNDHYYRQHRLLSALFSCSVVVYWVTIASMQRLINTGKVWGSFLLICYCSILSNGHYTASMGYFEVNSHTIAGRVFSCVFFLAFDFCRLGVIIRFYHPRHNAQWSLTSKDFYPRSYPLHFLSYLYSSGRASISLFNVWVPNKGTTGTIFITSLVWRGMEPGTSRIRSQHSTPRLSRRRCREVNKQVWK